MVRYVDDVLIIWEGGNEEINWFVDELNMLENEIQSKNVGNWEINYLDFNIKIKNSSEIEFNIHRKSVYSDKIILNDLYNPINYKMGTIYSICERVLKSMEDRKILKR